MLELFQLEFMQRALIAGIILAPLLSVLGSFATVRKMAFFADGIAHASLLGVALALLVGVMPFGGALVVGFVFGIMVFVLEKYSSIASDAVIGILFTTGLALGVIVLSLQPGYQPDLVSFLFGNVLSVTWENVWIILGLSIGILGVVGLFFRQLTLASFSEELAWVSGINTSVLNLVFYILLSVAVVLGVKLLGIILVSALLITPSVTAKFVTRSFRGYVGWSIIFSLLAFIGGLIGSYFLDLPSGAAIVVTSTLIFAAVMFAKKIVNSS